MDIALKHNVGVTCLCFWLSIINCISYSEGYASGAGVAACTTLIPGHGSASNAASPYTIQVLNGVTTYTPGTPVTGKFER